MALKENQRKSDSKPLDKTVRSRELALPILASQPNYSQAARLIGCSEEQIYAWLRDPEYKAQVDKARSELVNEAVQKLKAGMTKACDVLVQLLDDESPMIRRGVANDILNHAGKFIELKELEERIKKLESVRAA